MTAVTKRPDSPLLSRRALLQRAVVATPILLGLPALLGQLGCTRHRYVRPAGELDLGTVRELLYSVVHVRSKAILVFRDTDGWRALSARCTYVGCDLTFQEPILLCPCCKSQFDMTGAPLMGSLATEALPWIQVSYRKEEGHLYADPGKVVPATARFTTPEIEEAIRSLRERVKEEGLADEVKVPPLLQGSGDGEPGTMFVDEDPNLLHELDMIK